MPNLTNHGNVKYSHNEITLYTHHGLKKTSIRIQSHENSHKLQWIVFFTYKWHNHKILNSISN